MSRIVPHDTDTHPKHAPPWIVAEAEATLTRIRRGLGLGAAGWVATWFGAAIAGIYVGGIGIGLLVPLAGLGVAGFLPPTRRGRWARAVLRRWDRISIDRGFEMAGETDDPRLEAAQRMASRIGAHESTDDALRTTVEELIAGLRTFIDDLRTIDMVAESTSGHVRRPDARKARDEVEFRIAEILTALAAMHEAVMGQDRAATAHLLGDATEVIGHLEAREDVETMLAESNR